MNPSDEQHTTGHSQPDASPDNQVSSPQVNDYPTDTYQPVEPEAVHEAAHTQMSVQPEIEDAPVSWVAKEYVELDKGLGWYVWFGVIVLLLIAADIFILRSYTFSLLIVVMTVALIVYIRRPPRDIQYTLSGRQGLYVGERLYHLSEFRAFGLIKDGDNHSILLIPVKRFSPGVSVYFPEGVGEKIVDILGQRLPMEDLKLDIIDIVVRKIRL